MNKNELGITNTTTDTASGLWINSCTSNRVLLPLEMIWKPKEDITTHELALCLPYLFRNYGIMPYEIDSTLSYFRHFNIIDHNNK